MKISRIQALAIGLCVIAIAAPWFNGPKNQRIDPREKRERVELS